MSNPIYLIMGRTGEYSDRTEWPVAWFSDEEDAQSYIIALDKWLRENAMDWNCPDLLDYKDRDRLVDGQANPLDSSMRCDYTGTRYHYLQVQAGSKAE